MRQTLLRWGIRYIIKPLNRLQQTSPKVYWSIVGILSTIQVGLNTPAVSQSISEIVGAPVDLTEINTYLLIIITTLMGSKVIDTGDPSDIIPDPDPPTRRERRDARKNHTL